MKRSALIIGLLTLSLAWTTAVRGQDKVMYYDRKTRKDDTVQGSIQSESPAGIKIKVTNTNTVKDIPAADINEVDYKLGDTVKGYEYKLPFSKEAEAHKKKDVAERVRGLVEAQQEYERVAGLMRDNKPAARYLLYRSVLVQVQMGQLDPKKHDAAIDALKAFCKDHADGWETVKMFKQLAQLQEKKGDILAAKDTYVQLQNVEGIPKELVLECTLLTSNLLLRVEKYDEAETMLLKAQKLLPDDDPQKPLIIVHLCEVQLKLKKAKDVPKQLQAAIDGSSDANIRAAAHNTLGDYYLQMEQKEEAFWQFLRVDVLYSQDREEHARALFWLSKLYESVKNDKGKAQECLERLKSKDYEGTEYARRLPPDK